MPTGVFLGNVLPAAYAVSFDNVPHARWEAEGGLVIDIYITIAASIVTVSCEMNHFAPSDIHYVYLRAYDLVRAAVDVLAFGIGVGLSVSLHTFIDPWGQSGSIVLQDLELAKSCTSFVPQPQGSEERDLLQRVLLMVFQEPALFMALNDLIPAITIPHHAPVNCARALDGIRKLIAPDIEGESAWMQLQLALLIDADYGSYISKTSRKPRHGDRTHIPGSVTQEVVRRTWKIMDRYLEYRKRGNVPLPPDEFDMLTG